MLEALERCLDDAFMMFGSVAKVANCMYDSAFS